MPLYRKTRNLAKGDHILSMEWSRNFGKVGSYLIIRKYVGNSDFLPDTVSMSFLAEVKYRIYSDGSYTFQGIQMKANDKHSRISVLVPKKNLIGVVPQDLDVTDRYAVKKYAKQVMKQQAPLMFSKYQKWERMEREYKGQDKE